jgi:hypothetical protein
MTSVRGERLSGFYARTPTSRRADGASRSSSSMAVASRL